MKNKILVSSFIALSIFSFAKNIYAEDSSNLTATPTATLYSDTITNPVKSITLSIVEGNKIKWAVDGYSKKGFKVVWSKNENPTYPLRDGDKYHYFENPNYYYDRIDEAFSDAGKYYVRVCEYLGDSCGVYSNQISIELSKPASSNNKDVKTIKKCAKEWERTSGTVSPEYQYGCCDGLITVDDSIDPETGNIRIGGGSICIKPTFVKIPNIESIQEYVDIKKIGISLYGFKIESIIPTGYEKISKLEDVKYYKNIKKIGNSLYGIKISNEKKLQIQKKIGSLNEQIIKLQKQIEELNVELNKIQ